MAKKIMKGKFITFEGPEGCGKSTQSKLLYKYLQRNGFDVIYLREPGGTLIGERIRKILLDSKNDSMSSMAEMLLYMTARAQVVSEIIKPALIKRKVVICDRFLDSTLAYQGYGLGININLIKGLGNSVIQGVRPDLTILLDLPVKKGLKYRHLKKDRIEKRSLQYHTRVRNGYLKLAALDPKRIRIVKVSNDKFTTHKKIRKLALDLLVTSH